MTNKLRVCTNCKTRYPIETMFRTPAGWFHTFQCAIDLANTRLAKKAVDKKKKIDAEFNRTFYENDVKTRKKAAKDACHLYIRTRDKDQPCICCGRPVGENFHAGHFLESGNYSHLRYDERNIHAQNIHCNMYKGGNSDDYEGRLRIKIGNAAVDEMKASKSKVTKRTVQDYKDIENYYKRKLEELQA